MFARFLYRLRYYLGDAWDEWRYSMGVNLLALGTLASSLFVAGLVMLVLFNVDRRVAELGQEVRLDIYLTDTHERIERDRLIAELQVTPGVQRVEFVDKATALERYREWAAELASLVNELDDNPLPASLETFLVPGSGAGAVAQRISDSLRDRRGVEQVRFNLDALQRYETLLEVARVGVIGLTLLIFAAVVFVMASVLRLAVLARREEIEIMQLVGATPGFIRGPFLVAGAVQGIVGAAAALALIELVRSLAFAWGGDGAPLVELFAMRPLPAVLGAGLAGLGLLVSLTGSWFAVKRAV